MLSTANDEKYGCYSFDYHPTHPRTAGLLYRRILLACVFSILVHLMVIMWPIDFTPSIRPNIPSSKQPLIIRFMHAQKKVIQTRSNTSHTIAQDKLPTPVKNTPSTQRSSKKTALNSEHHEPKKTPGVPIQRIYDSIPSVLEGMGKRPVNTGQATIFDPRLRKAIIDSRREVKARLRRKPISDTSSQIVVTGKNEDSISIRINNRCWKVPVDGGQDQFAVKVWMLDLTCPKRSVGLFDDLKQ